jgi:hypothetical protein
MDPGRVALALAGQLLDALDPLERALASRDDLADFLARLGWEVAPAQLPLEDFRAAIGIIEDVREAADLAARLSVTPSSDIGLEEALELLEVTEGFMTRLDALASADAPANLPSGLWESVVEDLPDALLAWFLEVYLPYVAAFLAFIGALRAERVDLSGVGGRVSYTRYRFDWARLRAAFDDPAAVARGVYGWGAGWEGRRLIAQLGAVARFLGQRSALEPPQQALVDALYPETPPAGLEQLRIELARVGLGDEVELAVSLLLVPAADGGAGALALGVGIDGTAGTLTTAGVWSLELTDALASSLVARGVFAADGSSRLDLDPGADARGSVTIARRPPAPALLIGDPVSTHAVIRAVALSLDLEQTDAGLGWTLRLRFEDATLRLDLGGADGFLGRVAGTGTQEVDVAAGLVWSKTRPLHFEQAGALRVVVPLAIDWGVVRLRGVTVALENGNGLGLTVSATGDTALGPVKASVEDVGVRVRFTELAAGAPSGAFGKLDVDPSFKPPTGVALSIDAAAVTGGGFLFFDSAREQYAGGLHLEFDKLTLDAIGLLTTRMPDGSRGFSLLVIVRATGFAPIPLGFGFSLTGVGGLLGVNRTVALDVLRAGVRNRTLDSILFSKDDPTPRAPQIVSTLQTVFPPAPGRYVFGPMAQIGWGPPNAPVLLIEVALLLELPAPLRLIILGRIRAGLPQPDKAIVKLNLDVVGIIDFDRRELSVDASLFDSFVGPFALTGDMAARANWGERPDFALSLGGFHPAYPRPEKFPELRRLALTLSTGDNPRLRMEAYLALTSNTVQLGARLDFYVGVAGFSLEGGFGFDALIQLSPFRLQAEIDAGLTLKKGSATLMHLGIHVNIVGPSPWEVWGEAKFKLLFISITVPFRARFGRPEALPEAERTDVWLLLSGELTKPENWRSELPAADNRLATLIGEPAPGEALAHPLGALVVNQRSVPLERTLGLFGTAPPREASRFEITGATGLVRGGDLYDWFAPAQFRRMTDAERLASPAFDRMVSGAELGPSTGTVAIGNVQGTPLDYETVVVLDLDDPARETAGDYVPSAEAVGTLAERGPAAVAELRDQGRAKFAPETSGPAVGDPEYVVATRGTMQVVADGHDGTYSGAVEALRGRADADRLQVVRREETELVPA